MGRFWSQLSYAHISGSALDKIYRKMALEDIYRQLSWARKNCLSGKDYLEKAICIVDRYSNKMLEFADIAREATISRMYSIAYDVSREYLERLESNYELFGHSGSCS